MAENCEGNSCLQRNKNISQTISYIKRKLGHPVICVEIDDSQLVDIICDSVADADRYLYGEGNYRHFMAFEVKKDISEYKLDCSITDVIEFDFKSGIDGLNILHSPTHTLIGQEFVTGSSMVGSTRVPNSAGTLVSYDIAQLYLKEISNHFSTNYDVDFHEPSKILSIKPTPKLDGIGMLKVWKKSEINDMLNHPLVKELMVGRAMQQWGLHLSKYQIQMPGGGSANGDTIYSNGVTKEENVLERLRNEGEFPQFFVG